MTTQLHPTVLLGLDGATFSILDPLCEQGVMPNLRALMGRGARGLLLSTPHPLTPPAWTTVMTGKTPGHHGIFDFLRAERRATGAFFTLNSFRDIQTETIWSIVDRAGGKVLSVNFPLTAPPPHVNGVVVPGLLSARHLRLNVHPPEVYEQLKTITGNRLDELTWDFSNETKALQAVAPEELERWVRFHIVRETRWFEVLHTYMQSQRFDLTAVVFDGVDKLQHACWRLLDPMYTPRRPSDFERGILDECLTYFRKLDGFIGKILDAAPKDARVLVVSDHGFGPTQKLFRVNSWLAAHGYLQWPADGEPQRNGLRAGHHVAIDMAGSTAYAQSGATNGIHIRVSERPGDGGVLKGDYHVFRQRLIDQLLAVQDPLTGTRMVREVLTREEAFPGPYMDRAPDLTLVMFDHGFVSVVRTDDVLTTRPEVIGTHYPDGVLIAAGPGIAQGKQAPRQSIVDVASTVLYSLGLPVPEDFEGRVMDDLFESDILRRQPMTIGPPTLPLHEGTPAAATMNLDRAEEEKILNQLRALGYVE